MTYILIVLLNYSSGVGSMSAEFSDLESCMKAKSSIERHMLFTAFKSDSKAWCFKKSKTPGEPQIFRKTSQD